MNKMYKPTETELELLRDGDWEKFSHLFEIMETQCLDLRGSDLRYADLTDIDLRGADLSFANLFEAILQRTDLTHSNMERTNLKRANLYNANMTGVNLKYANMRGANLQRANLYNANMTGAMLQRSNLFNCQGNGKEIITLKISGYIINLTKDFLNIGYKTYNYDEWFNFTDEVISEMYGSNLYLWKKYKKLIFEKAEKAGFYEIQGGGNA